MKRIILLILLTTLLLQTTTAECIELPNLMNYITEWKQGNLGMVSLMEKIAQWKAGTGCGEGNNYYLDPINGNDNNPGTEQQPWKTIQKIENSTNTGDSIYIKTADKTTDTPWPQGRNYYAKQICKKSKEEEGPEYKNETLFETSSGDMVFRNWNEEEGKWVDLQPGDKALNPFNRKIVWTFDKYYPAGQFANNDVWVIGPVKVTRIEPQSFIVYEEDSPAKTGKMYPRIINGSMINPLSEKVDAVPNSSQGFDSEISCWNSAEKGRIYPNSWAYDEAMNVARVGDASIWGPRKDEAPTNPDAWTNRTGWTGKPIDSEDCLSVPTNSTLVSSISVRKTWWEGKTSKDAPRTTIVWFMAPLTVLEDIPADGSFRPPVYGEDKTIRYNKNQIDYVKLSGLQPVNNALSLADATDMYDRLNFDYWASQEKTRHIRPADNCDDYGAGFSEDFGEAALVANLDYPEQDKEDLVIGMIQLGIDNTQFMKEQLYYEYGTSRPGEGGGGRKFPIVFASHLLGEDLLPKNGDWWKTADHVFGDGGKLYMCVRGHVASSDSKPGTGAHWERYWHLTSYWPDYPKEVPFPEQIKEWAIGERYSTNHVFHEDTMTFYVGENDVDRYLTGINCGNPTAVVGTDGKYYRCIQSHEASTSNKPVTGQNWQEYWEYTHDPVSTWTKTWVEGTSMTGPSGVGSEQYSEDFLGKPEWSSRIYGPTGHSDIFYYSNAKENSNYRDIVAYGIHGTVLAAHIMQIKDKFVRSLIDYEDRYHYDIGSSNPEGPNDFVINMWNTYRKDYGCTYQDVNPETHTRIYKCGAQTIDCKDISNCENYPSQRAKDYDPCQIGCS